MLPSTLTQIVGLFNIFVGLMLTASVLFLGGGLMSWFGRLGTSPTYRDDALKTMQIGVEILFSLIIILLLSQFVQEHTASAVFVLGLVILAFIAWLIRVAAQDAAAAKQEK